MAYQDFVKDAKEALDEIIGRHGITVVLDALSDYAGEVTMQMTEEQKREWWLIEQLIAMLAGRTNVVLTGGVSTEGR